MFITANCSYTIYAGRTSLFSENTTFLFTDYKTLLFSGYNYVQIRVFGVGKTSWFTFKPIKVKISDTGTIQKMSNQIDWCIFTPPKLIILWHVKASL